MENGKWKMESRLLITPYLLLLIFCFSILISQFSFLNAADPKKDLIEIEKTLQEERQKIKEAKRKEDSILSELDEINKAIKNKSNELTYYDTRLSQTNTKIKLLKNEISLLTRKLENKKRILKERLNVLYKQQYSGDIALILISANDYQDFLRMSRYISLIVHYDSKLMETYSDEIKKINSKKMQLETLQKELLTNKEVIRTKMDEMKAEHSKKDKLLASIKSERSTYEKMVKELEESSKNLQALIKEMEKEKPPPSTVGKGLRPLKGRLPWPVDGEVLIPFGKYKDTKFNILMFKNGIEIKANTDETAKAVHEGRVVYADWFKGYGQLLIINHGDGYHSLYGNLSEIFHKTGDIISKGTPVGKVGESGILNVPALYFEIRHKGKPLDPIGWLRKSPEKKN